MKGFMSAWFLFGILVTLIGISLTLHRMEHKMSEILTNAAECGDVDCDDGYSYARSRQELEALLSGLNSPTSEKAQSSTDTEV